MYTFLRFLFGEACFESAISSNPPGPMLLLLAFFAGFWGDMTEGLIGAVKSNRIGDTFSLSFMSAMVEIDRRSVVVCTGVGGAADGYRE